MRSLVPDDAEVLGLAALIAISLSHEQAHIEDGQFVPLEDQDPSKWNAGLIQKATSYLSRAQSMGQLGRFQLQAAIQSVHADRLHTSVTNWPALLQLHLGLSHIAPTIGAAVSYAAAIGKAGKPEEGLIALLQVDEKVQAGFKPAQATLAYPCCNPGKLTGW